MSITTVELLRRTYDHLAAHGYDRKDPGGLGVVIDIQVMVASSKPGAIPGVTIELNSVDEFLDGVLRMVRMANHSTSATRIRP